MSFFGVEFNNLRDLFVYELKDLYDAEQQLISALPTMSQSATDPQLRQAFDTHLQQTRQHAARLEQIFDRIGCERESESCPAMKGIIKEGSEVAKAQGDPSVRDAALIAAAQRAEHYEMASYGSVRTFASQLGMSDVASLLQQTLDEEGQTDKLLTRIAEGSVNPQAQMHA